MSEISATLDIVRPEIDSYMAEDIIGYFRKLKGYENVPDFMIRDVFKSYFNSYEDMKYECGEHMYWWHEMLQNTSNYLLKTVTENKPGYSFIAMKHIIKLLRDEIEKDENLKDKCQNPGGGDGDQDQQGQGGGQPDFSDANQNLKDNMEQAVKTASDEIDKKQEAQETMGDSNLAGKTPSEIELVEQRMEILRDVVLSKKEVGKMIKRSIKGFRTGFGSKSILTEESLFEADVIEDMIDEHYLFDTMLSMDVNVRDTRQQMVAFDLYIDISGSMDSQMNVYGKSVNRLQMATALAVRMQAMGCLGQTYIFNTNIKKINEDAIWHLRADGGTSIEKCMCQIKKLGRPSVILTDGDDGFSTYTDNAFIMTISPSTGRAYRGNALVERMIKNRKYIQYDGTKLITPKISKN